MFSFLFRRRRPEPARAHSKLNLESLEDRTVPATFTVTQISDEGEGTLRDAVNKANATAGADTIVFDKKLDGQAIILSTGELQVTDDLLIDGNGVGATGFTSNRSSRIFNVENPGKSVVLKLQDLQMYAATGVGEGGAVRVAGGTLELDSVSINDNSADKGGGIAILDSNGRAGELYMIRSSVANNRAQSGGGGIHVASTIVGSTGANLRIIDSMVTQNSASNPSATGGGVNLIKGNALIDGSTIAENTSTGEGGGINIGTDGNLTIVSSTIHNNASTGGLGGGGVLSRGQLSVYNSTITGNSDNSAEGAGGVRHLSGTPMQIASTIVAENIGTNSQGLSADVRTSVDIASDGHNLIGNSAGVQGIESSDLVNMSPKLGPLLYNGGFSPSRVPLPGSPVIGKGSNVVGETTDQRGTGFSRATQNAVDIGSVQYNSDNAAPSAILTYAPNITLGSAANLYDFKVKYTDDTNVSALSMESKDITVYGPNGYSVSATPISVSPSTSLGKELEVTYRFLPAAGVWNGGANGTYTIVLNADQVFDEHGRPVVGQTLGAFVVDMPGDSVGFVASLYKAILGRDGDSAGIKAFTDRVNAGESRQAVAAAIWESEEHREIQVRQYYRDFLGREAESEGLKYWVEQFANGASEEDVMAGIASSDEFRSSFNDPKEITTFVYRQLLGRDADDLALNYLGTLQTGSAESVEQVTKTVALSEEAMEVQVSRLYQQILLRSSDAEGQADFVSRAKSHGIADAAIGLLASDEFFQLHGSIV